VPRYFFHLKDHRGYTDRDGTELPDDASARREAVSFLGAMLHDEPDLLWDGRDLQVHVRADDGRLVCTVVVVDVTPAENAEPGDRHP
jgi:hypothetical protein